MIYEKFDNQIINNKPISTAYLMLEFKKAGGNIDDYTVYDFEEIAKKKFVKKKYA